MKLFKRLMTALLAGVLAVGMLAGCSGAPAGPSTSRPSDAEAAAIYQGMEDACAQYNVKAPVYTAALEQIAKDYAEGVTIHKIWTDSSAAEKKAKADVAALADGAAYIGIDLNPYDNVLKKPLSTTNLKTKIMSDGKGNAGANCIGIVVVTLTNADTNEEAKYACTIFVRMPEAAAQN